MPKSLWKRALIVGASSGIGEALARELAGEGCRVALVARREEALRAIAASLPDLGSTPSALVYVHDVRETQAVPALFQNITLDLGGLDLVIYAAGVMPQIEPDEYDTEKDAAVIAVNFAGAVAWLNEAARRFERAGDGTIIGISSVAGDRGRRGYPVYNAAKAALTSYLESLRNRIARYGATVTTIKPGFVDTAMLQGQRRRPGVISAKEAAVQILAAARAEKDVAYVPGYWRLIMTVVRAIPAPLFKKMNF